MATAVASTQFADVDSQCPILPLPTPRTRKKHTLQTDSGQLADVPEPGRTGPGTSATRFRDQRVRRVSALWDSCPRISASPVYQLPSRDAGGV